MPRLAKSGLLGDTFRKPVENIPDGYLQVIEHGSLVYMIEKSMGGKSRMNKVASFIALGFAWEYLVQQLIASQKTGGDA